MMSKILVSLATLFLSQSFFAYAADKENSNLLNNSKKIAEYEAQEYRLREFWIQGFNIVREHYKNASPELNQDLSSFSHYNSLSPKERSSLKKRFPKLKSLETTMNALKESDLNLNSVKPLKQELEKLRPESISYIKGLVKDYQDSKVDLPYSTIDHLIGLNYDEVENTIQKENYDEDAIVGYQKVWSQTPYTYIRSVFQNISFKKDDVFYDLGSGYGRVLVYGGIVNPETKFRGIEIVPLRVEENDRLLRQLKLSNVDVLAQDILKSDFSDGTVFYVFNPFPSIFPQVLEKIKKMALKKKITIIAVGETYISLNSISQDSPQAWLKKVKIVSESWKIGIFETTLH